MKFAEGWEKRNKYGEKHQDRTPTDAEQDFVYTGRSELYERVAGSSESDLRERNWIFFIAACNWGNSGRDFEGGSRVMRAADGPVLTGEGPTVS